MLTRYCNVVVTFSFDKNDHPRPEVMVGSRSKSKVVRSSTYPIMIRVSIFFVEMQALMKKLHMNDDPYKQATWLTEAKIISCMNFSSAFPIEVTERRVLVCGNNVAKPDGRHANHTRQRLSDLTSIHHTVPIEL